MPHFIYYYSADLPQINDQTNLLKTHIHSLSHKHTLINNLRCKNHNRAKLLIEKKSGSLQHSIATFSTLAATLMPQKSNIRELYFQR